MEIKTPAQISRKPLTIAIALFFLRADPPRGARQAHLRRASLAASISSPAATAASTPHGGPAHLSNHSHRILRSAQCSQPSSSPPSRSSGPPAARRQRPGSLLRERRALVIVVLQIVLGVSNSRFRHISVPFAAAAHLGLGALPLADLIALFVSIKPSPVRAPATQPIQWRSRARAT